MDNLTFKGFAEKQAVHVLVERRPAGESFFAGQMVGRETELAELEAFVQPLFAPTGEQRYAGVLAVVVESNPFFVEQILLYLREQDRLVFREGTWSLVGSRGEVPLPDEVRTIFDARIDRLAEEIRAVVRAPPLSWGASLRCGFWPLCCGSRRNPGSRRF